MRYIQLLFLKILVSQARGLVSHTTWLVWFFMVFLKTTWPTKTYWINMEENPAGFCFVYYSLRFPF